MSDQKTLREQLNELEALVTWFERDDVDIEDAIAKFEEGSKLAESIRKELNQFENKITVLKKSFEEQ